MSTKEATNPPKKQTTRKLRHPVQASIIRLFLVTTLIITMFAGISSFQIQSKRILNEIDRDAVSALSLAQNAVSDLSFTEDISAGKYASTRIQLRNICQAMGMQYLYIYRPLGGSNDLFFYFCVASSDPDDALVRSERGYGTIAKDVELNPAEKAAMKGDTSSSRWSMTNEYGNVLSWTLPIFDYKHDVVALITVDCLVDSYDGQIIASIASTLVLALLLLFISMALEILLLRRRIFLPLQKISRQMSDFASGDSLKTEPLNITPQDEIQEIADSFRQMTEDIQVYMINQEHNAEERAQVRAQLELARKIQYGMVPAAFHQSLFFSMSIFISPFLSGIPGAHAPLPLAFLCHCRGWHVTTWPD